MVVAELNQFLKELKIEPPYLFVAHSLSGIFAIQYARTYPKDIMGIVFVDAPHPSEIAEQKKFKAPSLLRVINNGGKRIEKLFDKYKYSEDESITETSNQLKELGSFPKIPIAVLS